MTFDEVKEFFKSWGIFPSHEADNFNPEVIDQGINRACYQKMCVEAESKFDTNFRSFVSRMMDATDDFFYLPILEWKDLEEAFSKWDNRK